MNSSLLGASVAIMGLVLQCGCSTSPKGAGPTGAVPVKSPEKVPLPKVMTLVVGKTGSDVANAFESLSTETLLRMKIPVVDRATVQNNLGKIREMLELSGDAYGAASVGAQFGADVVLRAEIDVKQLAEGIHGSKLQSYQGAITLTAIDADNGQILSTASDSATAIALNESAGHNKVVGSVGASALAKLVPSMIQAWDDGYEERKTRGSRSDASLSGAGSADTGKAAVVPEAPASYSAPVTAIWRLTPQNEVPGAWMDPVTEKLNAILLNSKWFRLVTRDDMAKLMAEHSIQLSDVCDSTERAVEFGKILSAEKIVIGTVGKLGGTFQVVLKQVDVTTGEIERVGQAEARGGMDVLFSLVQEAAANLLGAEAGEKKN